MAKSSVAVLFVCFTMLAPIATTASAESRSSIGLKVASKTEAGANPIRKVVTMLQMMIKKVEAEGEKEAELFEKFMCYCKTSGGALEKSIADAELKIPDLEADIKEAMAKKAQLEEDVKQHKADRAAAEEAMKEATAIREKEKAAYEAEVGDLKSYLDAMEKAIAALMKGMGKTRGSLAGAPPGTEAFGEAKSQFAGPGEFLQTSAAGVLRRFVLNKEDMNEADRQDLLAFLGEGSPAAVYVPQSGEIIGILKQMVDEMNADLGGAIEKEEAAVAAYEALMAAKTKEKEMLTKLIEEKLTRIADLGVKIAEMKNDLGDTAEALIEDKKFLEDLKKNCATKEKEWEERCKVRSEELLALHDTIKILNDDDALELFKKTLPSASFLQVRVTAKEVRQRALAMLRVVQKVAGPNRPQIDMIELALRGKKIGFEKVIQMIDEMVETLKKEQVDDDEKKEYCTTAFDTADDKKKVLEKTISDLEAAIEADKQGIAKLTEEIEALEDQIKALDKAVAEATEQRKEENEDYTELMSQDSAAKEVILFAKNRLVKFYNPALYKPPPKRELTEEERITVNMGGTLAPTNPPAGIAGTGIAVLASVKEHGSVAPPPPPETFGAYAKKGEESGGVIAMMNLLIKDLDKEMTEAETEEKLAQEEYEQFMVDAATKRTEDSKAITDKTAAKAGLEEKLAQEEYEQFMVVLFLCKL